MQISTSFTLTLSIGPRLILFVLFVLTDYLSTAFDGWFWPLMGFIIVPWTTLWSSYVLNHGGFGLWSVLFLSLLLLIDLASTRQVVTSINSNK